MLTAPHSGLADPPVLSTMTEQAWSNALATGAVGASAAFPVANSAYFYPVQISRPRTYVRAWWLNGTVVAGNVDVGIYTIDAANLATHVASTGAVAQAGVSDMQVVTIASITIGPGLYWLAISASSSTATFWRSAPNLLVSRPWQRQRATSHPLPASGTVVAMAATYIPVFGLAELTTV